MTATPLTPERLSEIAALCEAATPGPWRQDCQIRVVAGPDNNPTDIIDYDHALHGEPPGASELADLAFVAASRTAIPELLAEISRLQTESLAAEIANRSLIPGGMLAATELECLRVERDSARASLDLARTYSPFSAAPCPLCEYADGRHVKPCAMHVQIDEQSATIARLSETARAASENWMAACKQRDEARAEVATLQGSIAFVEGCLRSRMEHARLRNGADVAKRARIAALETGLREAIELADVPEQHQGDHWCEERERLLALAGALQSQGAT